MAREASARNVGTALGGDALLLNEVEVGFVDERGRVERVIAAPAPTLPAREQAELVVEEGDYGVQGCRIALADRIEESRHRDRCVVRHGVTSTRFHATQHNSNRGNSTPSQRLNHSTWLASGSLEDGRSFRFHVQERRGIPNHLEVVIE